MMSCRFLMTMAGAALLTGCDMRSDEEISTGLEVHIREHCMRSSPAVAAEGVEPLVYCNCLVDRLTVGKSTDELREMEENPASYAAPPPEIVRECRARPPVAR